MLDLSARPFLGVATELRAIQLAIGNVNDNSVAVTSDDKTVILDHLERLSEAIEAIGANLAMKSLGRLKNVFENGQPTYALTSNVLADIESRFADYLDDIKMFIVVANETKWLNENDELVGWEVALWFPSAIFEFEESAKCIALGRHTASVFHSMRVLEIAIRSISNRLKIPDPISPAARNWGTILSQIKSALDNSHLKITRRPGTEGAFLEDVYTSLDAVRNPWRNATMHVETIYAPHEAEHIFNCVKFLVEKLSSKFDENGDDVF